VPRKIHNKLLRIQNFYIKFNEHVVENLKIHRAHSVELTTKFPHVLCPLCNVHKGSAKRLGLSLSRPTRPTDYNL